MATEEDEIQLVDRAGDVEEDAGIFDRDEDPPCIRIDFNGGEEEEEDSEPRVEDERHIKHPGKFRLRLRVGLFTATAYITGSPSNHWDRRECLYW
jgi:hypothetical protein